MAIDRRTNLSKEEFEQEYLAKLKPVIVDDVATHWPASAKWSTQYFREQYARKTVMVAGKTMGMEAFLDTVESSSSSTPSEYLTGMSIPKFFPELLDDICPDLQYAGGSYLTHPLLVGRLGQMIDITEEYGLLELLICGEGGVFPNLHYDAHHLHAFIVQVCGEKEFTLYSPEQSQYVYPNPKVRNNSLLGDIHNVDLERFPDFAKAIPETVTVKPGGMIFVPCGWWHTTRMLSTSIAVTANSLTDSNLDMFFEDTVAAGLLKAHEKCELADIDECII